MKEIRFSASLEKTLDSNWNQYRKLFKKVCQDPSRKKVHDLRDSIQRLNALLEICHFMQVPHFSKDLIQSLQDERKSLGPLRNAQVELKLLRAYKRDPIYRFFKKRESKARRKALRSLKGISLKKQKSQIKFVEKELQKIQASPEELARLENRIQDQEKDIQKQLPQVSGQSPRQIHQLRIAAKQTLYQVEALQALTGKKNPVTKTYAEIHDILGEVQNEVVLIKAINKYLGQKKHAGDQLATDLLIDLTEDRDRTLQDATESWRQVEWRH